MTVEGKSLLNCLISRAVSPLKDDRKENLDARARAHLGHTRAGTNSRKNLRESRVGNDDQLDIREIGKKERPKGSRDARLAKLPTRGRRRGTENRFARLLGVAYAPRLLGEESRILVSALRTDCETGPLIIRESADSLGRESMPDLRVSTEPLGARARLSTRPAFPGNFLSRGIFPPYLALRQSVRRRGGRL